MSAKRSTILILILTIALAVPLTLVAACGEGTEGDQGSPSGSPSAAASGSETPSLRPTLGDTPSPADTADKPDFLSADPGYVEDLGGIFQIVGLRISPVGGGLLYVVSREEGKLVKTRLQQRPGVIDVRLYDALPHEDVVKEYTAGSGPIASAKFVFPPDDAVVVVRFMLRDTGAEPAAALTTTPIDAQTEMVVLQLDQ